MDAKTHKSAMVLIPPEVVWEPIQEIRRKHDRHVRRWMPHVTLAYPFRPPDRFDEVAEQLAPVCAGTEPFDLTLAQFRHFSHGRSSFTLWLDPEPKDAVIALQVALMHVVPDCNDVTRHRHSFTPHLSVGQCRGLDRLNDLQRALAASWRPISFTVRQVSFVRRDDPPDDVFRLAQELTLGKHPAPSR